MARLPGVPHLDAVRALEKAGFWIKRQGKHIEMTDGVRIVTVLRNNSIDPSTMGTIIRGAGLTVEQFRKIL